MGEREVMKSNEREKIRREKFWVINEVNKEKKMKQESVSSVLVRQNWFRYGRNPQSYIKLYVLWDLTTASIYSLVQAK